MGTLVLSNGNFIAIKHAKILAFGTFEEHDKSIKVNVFIPLNAYQHARISLTEKLWGTTFDAIDSILHDLNIWEAGTAGRINAETKWIWWNTQENNL